MNPFSTYPGIRVNGKFYSKSELERRENYDQEAPFVKDILSFSNDLFSDSMELPFQTSGSTGKPKELSFSKEAIHKSANSTNEYFGLKKGIKAFLSLPVDYVAGKMMIARAIAGEYELIAVEPSSKPLQANLAFQFAPFTPHQFESVLSEQIDLLPKDSIILLGGSYVSESLRKKISQISNPVYLGFGMTETLTHFAVANLKSPSETFELMPDAEIQVDDQGTLSIRRQGITDSWLETTDIVEPFGNGFIWKGRKDNVINSGGVKLHPEEIEQEFARHLNSPFFVYGVKDDVLGEKVVLFIEGDNSPDLKEMRFSNKFFKPKDIVLLHAFLRTESGKIRRQATVKSWLEA
jgi:O-succinylbenzoic acid--CoA ligase